MKIINNYKLSLGLEKFNELGFESEEKLDMELKKLLEIRPEFKDYFSDNNK